LMCHGLIVGAQARGAFGRRDRRGPVQMDRSFLVAQPFRAARGRLAGLKACAT
jgi:hypothetical protein